VHAATTSSTIAQPSQTANSSSQPNTGTNRVVYLSSFDGAPGVGQVFVYPASLSSHPSSPKRIINHGTVRPYCM